MAPLLGEDLSLFFSADTRVHVPHRVRRRRLSRLFFTSKFPKPARQSADDRTADVPPTMSFWALALHKRGNSKNCGMGRGDQRGQAGTEHGSFTIARHDGIEGSACRTRRSYNAHFSYAPCFSTVRPLLVSSPLASGLP